MNNKKFTKVAKYKINTQKLNIFIYANWINQKISEKIPIPKSQCNQNYVRST